MLIINNRNKNTDQESHIHSLIKSMKATKSTTVLVLICWHVFGRGCKYGPTKACTDGFHDAYKSLPCQVCLISSVSNVADSQSEGCGFKLWQG